MPAHDSALSPSSRKQYTIFARLPLLLYSLQKHTFKLFPYLSNVCCHSTVLHHYCGTGVIQTHKLRVRQIFIKDCGKLNKMALEGLQLPIAHTKFRENYTTGSEVEIRGRTDTGC
jgi:hypothetical protein